MNMNDKLEQWLSESENEHLEFKGAANQFNSNEALKYCVALANEGGGYLVLGISDKTPRIVTGTQAFGPEQLDKLKKRVATELRIRVEGHEIMHTDGRVLAIKIPPCPTGQPLTFKGQYLMRAGESTVTMTPDRLKEIFRQDSESWLMEIEIEHVDAEKVTTLLDTEIYFKLINLPYPDSLETILDRLETEELIRRQGTKWGITNMAAILLAKNLDEFPQTIARKAPRFIIYEGTGKLVTRDEKQSKMGYAVDFGNLVDLVHDRAPQNRFIEETLRIEYKMFPQQALRELIANALVHQDFSMSGMSVMIEMYSDRVEISNPGTPIINVNRFIDSYKPRNAKFANIMRRFRICEEKGSGIDKVIESVEFSQLPAPDFRKDDIRTTVVLFGYVDFSDMTRQDRIRACYQHCCLCYVGNERMSNASLRKRFNLTDKQMGTVSQLITQTKEMGLIKIDVNRESSSSRYIRYMPSWG